MRYSIFAIASLFAVTASAQYCGVVTSLQTFVQCSLFQYPPMDSACEAIGGTVAGHLAEAAGAGSNCVTYCNNVTTGGHDTTASIYYSPGMSYHLEVVDLCTDCDYCGP